MNRRLGKLAPAIDKRTLKLAKYLKRDLPDPPASVDYSAAVRDWRMLANDSCGDCTCAAAGHQLMAWGANAGSIPLVPTADEIVRVYSAISGYNPKTGENDNGCVLLDVLKYWRKHGIGGHKIGAFASIHPQDQRTLRQAIYLFGGVILGVNLPIATEDQKSWHLPPAYAPIGRWRPGSWSGHAIFAAEYQPTGYSIISWGELIAMTNGYADAYLDEAWAVFSHDWVCGNGEAPNGIEGDLLLDDLEALE